MFDEVNHSGSREETGGSKIVKFQAAHVIGRREVKTLWLNFDCLTAPPG